MDYDALYSSTARRLQPSIIRALLKVVQDPQIFSLAGGTPDSGLFDLDLYATLADRAARTQGRSSLQYGETLGWRALREQVALYMASRGVKVTPDQVLITTGSQQGIDLLGRLFVDAGDTVAMEAPGYLGAIILFRNLGAHILALPLADEQGLDPAHLEAALDAAPTRPKFLYLTPTYQNPSGACLSAQRRQALVELASRRGLLLIEDDPYGEISFDGPPPKPLLAYDSNGHTVFLGSFSKMAVPGLRIGWAVGPPELIQKMAIAKESADVCSSVLSQAIAAEFLAGGHLKSTLPRLVSAYRSRRDCLRQALLAQLPAGTKLASPQGGFFLWAELPGGVDTQADFQRAIEAKVAFVPGSVFYPQEGQGQSTLRLSYCAVPEDKLVEGARRLGQVLALSGAR